MTWLQGNLAVLDNSYAMCKVNKAKGIGGIIESRNHVSNNSAVFETLPQIDKILIYVHSEYKKTLYNITFPLCFNRISACHNNLFIIFLSFLPRFSHDFPRFPHDFPMISHDLSMICPWFPAKTHPDPPRKRHAWTLCETRESWSSNFSRRWRPGEGVTSGMSGSG